MFNNTEKFEDKLLEENLKLKEINERLKKEIDFTCRCINIMGDTIEELEEENEELREDNLRLSEIEDRHQFLIAELTEFKTQLLFLLENKDKGEEV